MPLETPPVAVRLMPRLNAVRTPDDAMRDTQRVDRPLPCVVADLPAVPRRPVDILIGPEPRRERLIDHEDDRRLGNSRQWISTFSIRSRSSRHADPRQPWLFDTVDYPRPYPVASPTRRSRSNLAASSAAPYRALI